MTGWGWTRRKWAILSKPADQLGRGVFDRKRGRGALVERSTRAGCVNILHGGIAMNRYGGRARPLSLLQALVLPSLVINAMSAFASGSSFALDAFEPVLEPFRASAAAPRPFPEGADPAGIDSFKTMEGAWMLAATPITIPRPISPVQNPGASVQNNRRTAPVQTRAEEEEPPPVQPRLMNQMENPYMGRQVQPSSGAIPGVGGTQQIRGVQPHGGKRLDPGLGP